MKSWFPRLVMGLAALAGCLLARPAPLVAVDQAQERLDQAAPLPQGALGIGQTFTPRHNGLSRVEVLTVVYAGAPPGSTTLLEVSDAAGVVARSAYVDLAHNTPLRLDFAPQPASAGRAYTLTLTTSPDAQTTLWSYSPGGYDSGSALQAGAPSSGDLKFTTSYTYQLSEAIADVRRGLLGLGRMASWIWALLLAPGLLLLRLWPGREAASPWTRWALTIGLSLSVGGLLWLWPGVIGLGWKAAGLQVLYGLLGMAALGLWARDLPRWRDRGVDAPAGLPLHHHLAMAVIVGLGLAVRLLAVRDQAFPAWVDSPHHTLITRLLVETGRVPAGYQPLLDVDVFTYHFGFHALAASLHLVTGQPLPELFLLLGQLLNALAPLAAYALAAQLTRRPPVPQSGGRAGLIAAFVVALVSLFPAYYVSWGRYTQLAGLLILVPAQLLTWQLAAGSLPARGTRWLAGLLFAGLLLTHYRVLAFLAVFVLVALAAGARGGWKRLAPAGAWALLLSLPWLVRLLVHQLLPVLSAPASLASFEGYNQFPVDYFRGPLERGWLGLAVLGAALGLLRRQRTAWLMAGWVAATSALLNIGPGTWLVNNNAWAISLFLPASFFVGQGGDGWLEILRAWAGRDGRLPRALGLAGLALAAGLAGWAGVSGAREQAGVLNTQTVLAVRADAPALAWVEQNVPASAVLAINSWEWLAGAWAGGDGGAWLWPLLGRRTTLPPHDYIYGSRQSWQQINDFNRQLAAQTEFQSDAARALLRSAGVTHIFIGARGGFLKPELFLNSPYYRQVYARDGVWVFELAGKTNDK